MLLKQNPDQAACKGFTSKAALMHMAAASSNTYEVVKANERCMCTTHGHDVYIATNDACAGTDARFGCSQLEYTCMNIYIAP